MKLLSVAHDPKEHALLALAITTGMRQGELFALYWDDVNLENGTVSIRRTLSEDYEGRLVRAEPKTAKSRRVVFLPQLARRALLAWRQSASSGQEYVFTSPDGAPLRKTNFIRRSFKPLLEKAQLPMVTFHSLRHTANSLLIEAGEDPLAIAGSLGHADTRMMFERYGHLFSHTAKHVAETADRIFGDLEANCRTIVVHAEDRFTAPRSKRQKKPLRRKAFPLAEMRDSNPRPLTCEISAASVTD